jgi:hypothetical protein
LLLRFTDDDFLSEEETTATIGVDFKVKSIELDGHRYKLSVWVCVFLRIAATVTGSPGCLVEQAMCSMELLRVHDRQRIVHDTSC